MSLSSFVAGILIALAMRSTYGPLPGPIIGLLLAVEVLALISGQ